MQEMWVWSLGWEDPLEEKNSNSLQFSCLRKPMDRGDWWATVHRVAKNQTWTSKWALPRACSISKFDVLTLRRWKGEEFTWYLPHIPPGPTSILSLSFKSITWTEDTSCIHIDISTDPFVSDSVNGKYGRSRTLGKSEVRVFNTLVPTLCIHASSQRSSL